MSSMYSSEYTFSRYCTQHKGYCMIVFVLDHVTPYGAQIKIPRAKIAQESWLHLLAVRQQPPRGQNSAQVPHTEKRRLHKVSGDI